MSVVFSLGEYSLASTKYILESFAFLPFSPENEARSDAVFCLTAGEKFDTFEIMTMMMMSKSSQII